MYIYDIVYVGVKICFYENSITRVVCSVPQRCLFVLFSVKELTATKRSGPKGKGKAKNEID